MARGLREVKWECWQVFWKQVSEFSAKMDNKPDCHYRIQKHSVSRLEVFQSMAWSLEERGPDLFCAANQSWARLSDWKLVGFKSICKPATKYAPKQTGIKKGTHTRSMAKGGIKTGTWRTQTIQDKAESEAYMRYVSLVCKCLDNNVHRKKKRPNKLGIGSHTLARVPRITTTSNPAGTLICLRISAALQTHFQHFFFCARSVWLGL